MPHNKNRNKKFSQNRIANKKLIQKLVNQSGITEGDLVYDIGAGSGTISQALLNQGARVIAIENDPDMYQKCKQRLINRDRFELYLDDFMICDFPPASSYKVFSNIPFIHTAEIVNKLLFNPNPPQDCYLILQKEAAEKYAGIPVDTLASLFIKPLFWTDILYHFDRKDFFPVPSVDIVLLQILKRKNPLVANQHYRLYRDFIVYCREGADRTIKKSLKQLFTYAQQIQLFRLLDIANNTRTTELSFTQYLGIFQFYLYYNYRNTGHLIRGAEDRMLKKQAGMVKIHRTRNKM